MVFAFCVFHIIQIYTDHTSPQLNPGISKFFTGEMGPWFGTAAGRSSSNHCFSLCPKDPIAAVQTSDVATPDLWCHCRGVR